MCPTVFLFSLAIRKISWLKLCALSEAGHNDTLWSQAGCLDADPTVSTYQLQDSPGFRNFSEPQFLYR